MKTKSFEILKTFLKGNLKIRSYNKKQKREYKISERMSLIMRQKNKFFTLICSLVPGAGELYMGFKKQGVSTMAVCCAVIALADATGIRQICLVLPIVWAYSFFNVHHLKSMPEEEFAIQKDEYIMNLDYVLEHKRELLKKYRAVIALVLIITGISVIWHVFGSVMYRFLPVQWVDSFFAVNGMLKNVIVAALCLGGGIYLAVSKEKWQDFVDEE